MEVSRKLLIIRAWQWDSVCKRPNPPSSVHICQVYWLQYLIRDHFEHGCNNIYLTQNSQLSASIKVYSPLGSVIYLTVRLNNYEGVQYICDLCDCEATSKSYLILHMETKYEGLWYFCNKCNHEVIWKSFLSWHNKSKHEGVPYVCDQCDYVATKKGSLICHKGQNMNESSMVVTSVIIKLPITVNWSSTKSLNIMESSIPVTSVKMKLPRAAMWSSIKRQSMKKFRTIKLPRIWIWAAIWNPSISVHKRW